MTRRCLLPLTLVLLLPMASTQAAPPVFDPTDLPAYFQALTRSTDPEAVAIRKQIVDGPADLARERALSRKEGLLVFSKDLQMPLPPPDQNAAPLYTQLDALRKQKPLRFPMYAQALNGRYTYTPAQLAAVQQEYEAHRDIFTLLHQATDKTQCVYVRDWSHALTSPFITWAGMRESAREIKTESVLLAEQGKFSAAVSNQARGFRLAQHTASEPTLIAYLVACALDAITLSGMQDILGLAGPNADVAHQVQTEVLAHRNDVFLHRALGGEMALTDAEFALLRSAKPAEFASVVEWVAGDAAPVPPVKTKAFTPAEQQFLSDLLDAAEADYLHQMRGLVEAADLPPLQRRVAFARLAERTTANPAQRFSDIVNPVQATDAIMLSISGTTDQQDRRSQAQFEVTLAAASLLAARAAADTFPETLPGNFPDPFHADTLPGSVIDPLNGQPLGYRREGTDGFVVYSVGVDGRFDGGKAGDAWDSQKVFFRYPVSTTPVPPNMLK